MTCDQVQEALLDEVDVASGLPEALERRLEACPRCAAVHVAQRVLDQQLADAFRPAGVSPGFRAALRHRIANERLPWWRPVLPEVVHLVACGAATVVCGLMLPVPSATTVMRGMLVTGLGYVVLVVVEEMYAA